MSEQEIKAELYDIEMHNCTGWLEIGPNGCKGESCRICSRVGFLRRELANLRADKMVEMTRDAK